MENVVSTRRARTTLRKAVAQAQTCVLRRRRFACLQQHLDVRIDVRGSRLAWLSLSP